MSIRFVRECVVAILLAGAATAQDTVADLPVEFTDKLPEEWLSPGEKASNPWWRDRVNDRFRLELADGRYSLVLRQLCADLRVLTAESASPLALRFLQQAELVTVAFEKAVEAEGLAGGLETPQQRSLVDQRMYAQGFGVQSLEPQWVPEPDGLTHALRFFTTEDDEEGLRASERTADGKYRLLLTVAELRRIRLAGDAFRFVLGHFIAPLQDEQLEALRSAERKWDGYLFDGYSQYPWEALFNGWVLKFDTFEPPERQWILAHPSLAFEASTVSLDEVQADEVLAIELLGHLWYYDENQEYWGASLAVTLRDDLDPGLGLMAHWSNKISLGVTWRDLDGDDHYLDDELFVLLSVDLFAYVQRELPEFQKHYKKVQGLLGK